MLYLIVGKKYNLVLHNALDNSIDNYLRLAEKSHTFLHFYKDLGSKSFLSY